MKDMEEMKTDWHLKASEVQSGLRTPLVHAFISILINLRCVLCIADMSYSQFNFRKYEKFIILI